MCRDVHIYEKGIGQKLHIKPFNYAISISINVGSSEIGTSKSQKPYSLQFWLTILFFAVKFRNDLLQFREQFLPWPIYLFCSKLYTYFMYMLIIRSYSFTVTTLFTSFKITMVEGVQMLSTSREETSMTFAIRKLAITKFEIHITFLLQYSHTFSNIDEFEETADVFSKFVQFCITSTFDFIATQRLYFEPKSIDQGLKRKLNISAFIEITGIFIFFKKTNFISPKKHPLIAG